MDDWATTTAEAQEPTGPLERRAAAWTAAVAVAGLGVVAVGTSRSGTLRPVIQATIGLGWQGVWPALFAAAALIAGLLTLRWWPWLLLAGSLLSLPVTAPSLLTWYRGEPWIVYLGFAGFPLVLLAVLAAAQELLDGGARGLGAALAGMTAGAGLAGAALAGTGQLRTMPQLTTWHALLALLGIAGGVLAVLGRRAGAAPLAPPRPGGWPTVLGILAALLVFVPVVLTDERISDLLDVSEASLVRRRYAVTIIVGLVVLGCGALLAAACGAWAAAGAAAAALAQVGVAAPLLLAVYAVGAHPGYGMAATVAGVVVGAVAAATRWRVQLAAAFGLGAALVVLVAVAATGGQPEKLIEQARWLPAGLLLAVLAASVTTTVAVGAAVAAVRGGLPATFGPILGALVVGGGQAMFLLQLRGGEPDPSYLADIRHLSASAGVLVAAALVVVGIGVAQSLRTRLQAMPART